MKINTHVLVLLLIILPVSIYPYVQKHIIITPRDESYAIDQENKIIVWNFNIDTFQKSNNDFLKVNFEENFVWSVYIENLSYTTSYDVIYNEMIFKLYITELPVIIITATDTIKDDPKIPSQFTYANQDSIKIGVSGIELRGNISLKFPKKSYDLEFWEDPEKETSTDMQFGNLRKDDDWILDGLYNEPLRIRSYVANKLWLSIHQPHYLNQEKEAKSGIDLMFVEVFLNNEYIGVHALMEQVDRKLLQLKKYKKSKVRGELFKASSYKGAPKYKMAPKYKNIFPHWAGYEIEYPFENYKAQWKYIYRFTKFVVKSKDPIFKKKIVEKFDLDNAIDYFLFINLVRATDNLGKNFYVARYDKKTPYFNIPWDLDGVLGTIQDGKRIPTTDDILSNGLFDRLLKTNPNNYRKKLKERWFLLRKQQFSDKSLFKNIQDHYDYFYKQKIYEREQIVWPSKISLQNHLRYIKKWLADRLQYLDDYFNKF